MEKIFYYSQSKKQIKLTLESLKINIEDMSKVPGIENNILKIDLPFTLLPLFYYKGVGSFQKLLAAIVKVGQNFENVFFDENKISIALNNLKDYQTIDKNKSVEKEKDFNSSKYKDISPQKKRIAKKLIINQYH